MKRAKPVAVVAFLLLAIGLLLLLAKPEQPRSFKLPDGSTLTLVGVTYGTNAFLRGSVLERLLGDHLPAKGINVLGRKIQRPHKQPAHFRPEESAPITAWFELTGRRNWGESLFSDIGRWRVFARSSTNREFENYPGRPMSITTNAILLALPIEAFPRTEKEFVLRMSLWIEKGRHTPVVEFRIANPAPIKPRSFRANPLPWTNHLDAVKVVLTGVRPETPWGSRDARLDLHLAPPAGKPLEWGIKDCTIEDEEGNRRAMGATSSGPSLFVDTRYNLATDKPWKVTVTVARTSNFPATELTALNFGSTNLVSITNANGQKFICRFDEENLEIESPSWATATTRPDLSILATDAAGKEVPFGSPSWHSMRGRYRLMRWPITKPVSGLSLQLVSPRTLQTEFVAMPESK